MVTGSHNPMEFNGLKVAYDKATLWETTSRDPQNNKRRQDGFTVSSRIT